MELLLLAIVVIALAFIGARITRSDVVFWLVGAALLIFLIYSGVDFDNHR